MPAQIRPNRLEVNDRFPMLGFTIRTHGEPKRAEVAVATDPSLFTPAGKAKRGQSNFYSSRGIGRPLQLPHGEAVFVLPPEVLARFVGSERLYFGLATAPATGVGAFDVDAMPTDKSPYVSLRALTGRSLRRIRVIPGRPRGPANGELEWAGDGALPGQEPAAGSNGAAAPKNGAQAPQQPVHYDDGFGPMPAAKPATMPPAPPARSNGAISAAPAPTAAAPAAATPRTQSMSVRALDADGDADSDDGPGIEGPVGSDVGAPTGTQMELGRAMDVTPEYSGASRFVAATSFRKVTSPRNINRVVIHVTDGPSVSSAVNTFASSSAHTSAHYIVGQDGEIVQMVRENDVAWHANSANGESIGIEHVAISRGGVNYPRRDGSMQHYDEMPPAEAQYAASAGLTAYLCNKYSIPVDRTHILGHSEADPKTSHRSCPNGAGWDWDHYMQLVRDHASAAQPAAQSLGYDRRTTSGALSVVDIDYAPSEPVGAAAALASFARRKVAWRAGVPNTGFMPHSAICHIEITGTDGSQALGTGFYVAPDLILTAAHVVDGASQLRILAGRNGQNSSLSDFTVGPDAWTMHPAYDHTRDYDMAVIRVSTAPPGGQYFSLEELSVSIADPIVVCGYAAEGVDPYKQHLDADTVRELSDNMQILRYNLQTTGGTSGSPVFYITGYEDEERQVSVLDIRVIGVHVASATATLNQACRLTANKIAWVNARGLASVAQSLAASTPKSATAAKNRARVLGGGFSARIDEAMANGLHPQDAHRVLDALDRKKKKSATTSHGLAVVDMAYAPSDPDAAAAALADFSRRQQSWRAGVPDTSFFPHSAICHFELPDGSPWGTGFYVGRDLIATAAHVLAGQTQLRARAGRNGSANLGEFSVSSSSWAIHPSYADASRDFDIGVIRTSTPPPNGQFFALEELDMSPAAPIVVCGYAAEGVDPTVQHLDADRVRELSETGEVMRYNLQTTGGTSGSPVFYMHGYEDEQRQMSIGDLRVVAVHVASASSTLNQACRLTRSKIAWLLAGGQVSVGQALQYQGKRANGSAPPAPSPSSRARSFGKEASVNETKRRSSTDTRDGVTFSLEQLDGWRIPPGQARQQTQRVSLDITDWPRMPDASGGTFGPVRITWEYGAGVVGNVGVTALPSGISDGWSLRVEGRVVDGPDAETSAGVTVELRHRFSKQGEPSHCSLVRVILHGDGSHERTNEWENDPVTIAA
jgi:V8-like Glu-specific endopeptidase/N-acetyl-anhydromuramyl-L-alanine amidase AmpD